MNAEIISYIIIVVLSIVVGILGATVHTERKSAEDLRKRISDSIPNGGDLPESKRKFEDTIAEIRKNGQDTEWCSNCRNNCNCSSGNTNNNILSNEEPLN